MMRAAADGAAALGATAAAATAAAAESLGRVVQANPIKPKLKAPGSKRLKLQYDELHSSIAFKFNLRRYNQGCSPVPAPRPRSWLGWRQLSTAWYGGAGGPYQTHVQSAWN